MDYRLVYNPGDTPLPIDEAGRVVGSHDWAAVDVSQPCVAEDLASERLLIITLPDGFDREGLDPAAADALREVESHRPIEVPVDAPRTRTSRKAGTPTDPTED